MSADNLKIYNAVRSVPEEAKKTITAGRIKGFTDINPVWRIKTLTDQFGPCGIGWYYNIKEKWLDEADSVKEVTANILIDLYVKENGEWSKPIQGIGGSKLVSNERGGLYVSDECWKMALTDAISVACKALGIGADVYWEKDASKYDAIPKDENQDKTPPKNQQKAPAKNQKQEPKKDVSNQRIPESKVKALIERCDKDKIDPGKICKLYNVSSLADLTEKKHANIIKFWEEIKKAEA